MSLAVIALAATVAGTVISAVGQLQAGQAAAQAGELNAQSAEADARAAKDRAALDEARSRRETRRFVATQRARFGAAGVTFTGTPLLVIEDTVREAELDALTIRFGGETEAARLRRQAALDRFEGKQAKRSSFFRAGTTLLTGGVSAAQQGKSLLAEGDA